MVDSCAGGVSRRSRLCARVVKGLDSKSNGVTRAGSNPAVVVLFLAFCSRQQLSTLALTEAQLYLNTRTYTRSTSFKFKIN